MQVFPEISERLITIEPEKTNNSSQDKITAFLQQLNISPDNIENLEELKQILHVELSFLRTSFRWAQIDSFIERLLQALVISRSAIDQIQIKNPGCTSNIWLNGRSLPLNRMGVVKFAKMIRSFINGIELTAFNSVHYFFYALLGYHVYQLLTTGRSSFSELGNAMFTSSTNGLLNIVQLVARMDPDTLHYLLYSIPVPTLLLSINALRHKEVITDEEFNEIINDAMPMDWHSMLYTELWQYVPVLPVSSKMQSVEQLLRWQFSLSFEQKEKLFTTIQNLAVGADKRIQRSAMESLAKLAHSFHAKDLLLLARAGHKPEDLIEYLSIKERSIKTLQELAQFKVDGGFFRNLMQYSNQSVRVLYANYLLWWIGQNSSWKSHLAFLSLKGAKLYAEVMLLINLVNIVQEALDCPKKPGFQFGEGFADWAGDYTATCFTARLKLFRTIDQAESVDKLIQEIQHYRLIGLTRLDLSYADLTGDDVVRIIKAVVNQGAQITELNLSHNKIGSLPADVFADFPDLQTLDLSHNQLISLQPGTFAGLTELQTLDLSYNQIESLPTTMFTELYELQTLKLGANRIATISSGTFTDLPALQTLEFYNNLLASLPPMAFTNLPELRILSFSYNQLTTISQGAFSDLPALQYIHLDSNQITSLSPGVFSNLPALQHIDLSGNKLAAILPGAFSNLPALQQIDLSGNKLVSLSPGVFSDLPELQRLSLDSNQLTTLQEGVFINLPKLEYLDFLYNQITNISIGAFANLTQEINLVLTGNKLTSLSPDVFAKSARLSLELSNNQFVSLPSYAFSGLSISILDLNSNQIISVQSDTFSGLSCRQLYLSHNKLTSLPEGIFKSLSLLELSLEDNQIADLPLGLFADLWQLQSLVISISNITILKTEVFSYLPNLEELALSKTELTIIPSDAFAMLPNLHVLYLIENKKLTTISVGAFNSLPYLHDLYLEDNQLTTGLQPGVFANLTQLLSLYLERNQLISLPTGVFADLPQLQVLSLPGNQLTDLQPGIFAGLDKLQEISLGENQLRELKPGVFADLSQLVYLDLDSNQITTLYADTFVNLQQLQYLDFSSNQLTSLPAGIFANLTKIETINLIGNQLTVIQSGVFVGLLKLSLLELQTNKLTFFDTGAFVNLPSLQTFSVSTYYYHIIGDNNISSIAEDAFINVHMGELELYYQYLTDLAIYNLTQCLPDGITHLNLAGNQIGKQGIEALAAKLPCTEISVIDLTDNPASGSDIDSIAQAAQLNKLKDMCESEICQETWPDQTSCIVPKPGQSSSQTLIGRFFTSIGDISYQVVDYALDSLCNMLGSYAQDVVSSCPSYFNKSGVSIGDSSGKHWSSTVGLFSPQLSLPPAVAPLQIASSNISLA